MTREQVEKMIENDFRFMVEWQGIEWGEGQDAELKRLIEVNYERFKEHLETYGEISEFQYK